MTSKLVPEVVILFVSLCYTAWATGKGVIDPDLEKRLFPDKGSGDGVKAENVVVSFSESFDTVFDRIDRMNFSSDGEKRNVLTGLQQAFAETSQGALKGFLRVQGKPFESYWINNKIIVLNASPGLIRAISNVPGVSRVEKEPVYRIDLPIIEESAENVNLTLASRQNFLAWGVRKIRANQVWRMFNGSGVVVANIDTGVRYTHEALRGRWRTDYGWYDPYRQTYRPRDQNGHGTHTMGTIAGSGGIGVAPGATWIACKGCDGDTCAGRQLLSCGQWIQCPTDPNGRNRNCSQAPKVVSNSWGMGQGDLFFNDVIRSWHTGGIIPVFSIGNNGPQCRTAGSPGDSARGVIGVGSINQNDQISSFSSLGPAYNGRLKPDVTAPGSVIPSAFNTGDTAYSSLSGTSMACPHVAGVIGLMLQKNPTLNYDQVWDFITSSSNRNVDISTARTCGGRNGSSFPNNVFGYGLVDAVNSIQATPSL